ncbi:hypothetical protein MHYP_G00048430 [Metynnis hypsauchen]
MQLRRESDTLHKTATVEDKHRETRLFTGRTQPHLSALCCVEENTRETWMLVPTLWIVYLKRALDVEDRKTGRNGSQPRVRLH